MIAFFFNYTFNWEKLQLQGSFQDYLKTTLFKKQPLNYMIKTAQFAIHIIWSIGYYEFISLNGHAYDAKINGLILTFPASLRINKLGYTMLL